MSTQLPSPLARPRTGGGSSSGYFRLSFLGASINSAAAAAAIRFEELKITPPLPPPPRPSVVFGRRSFPGWFVQTSECGGHDSWRRGEIWQ